MPAPRIGQATSHPSGAAVPEQGLLVYHTYENYDSAGSTGVLWLYDFATRAPAVPVSQPWTSVSAPMNAIFSADGQWLVFMGVANEEWNIFLWEVGSDSEPVNLTNNYWPGNWLTNEDPKFSADMSKVWWKRGGDIAVAPLIFDDEVPRLDLEAMSMLTQDGQVKETGENEDWMPMPVEDDSALYFIQGTGPHADIVRAELAWDESGRASIVGEIQPVAAEQGIQEYYPILDYGATASQEDDTVWYARWKADDDRGDALYRLRNGVHERSPLALDWADTADPWPVPNSQMVLYCATTGPGWAYELRSGNTETGESVVLDLQDGTTNSHLGPAYWAP
ncbi:MAG: DPP IV N-terminal domain-containing protein [Cellulomonadaceae bacterium]|nr:DPP IV N-terminal domain-containing protein [Cellulomonadaceae bacterium]